MPESEREHPVVGRADHDEYGVIDSDVDLRDPRQVAEAGPRELLVLTAIAGGGIIGALSRYGLAKVLTHPVTGMPWSTILINLIGSGVLGVLMVFVLHRDPHPLLRPFLGVGVCGGFTTFSTFALDLRTLLAEHRAGIAVGYLMITVFGCLFVVEAVTSLTRRLGVRS